MSATRDARTPVAAIVLAWVVVATPLGWGLYQSVKKSMPLFSGEKASTPSAAAPTAK